MSQPDKIFGLVKFLLKLFSQFRGEGCEIFLTQTDHQKGSGNHIVGFAMLIPQGAVQGQTHQLAIIVVDDGNRVAKRVAGTDAATDCLLQCFQIVVNLDLFRVLPRRDLQDRKSVFFHSASPQSMQMQAAHPHRPSA